MALTTTIKPAPLAFTCVIPPAILKRRGLETMPHSTSTQSVLTTIGLISLLLIALFPPLFHLILTLPLSLLPTYYTSTPQTETYSNIVTMSWVQKQFALQSRSRGSYLITDQVLSAVPEIKNYKVGLLTLFIQHTSCGLSLNENCQ